MCFGLFMCEMRCFEVWSELQKMAIFHSKAIIFTYNMIAFETFNQRQFESSTDFVRKL